MTRGVSEEDMALKDSVMKEEDPKWRPARVQHRFLVLRKLGEGTYGKVQLALQKETNEEVAIKTIKKAKIESEEDMLRIRREIQIMSSIRHPHIIHINEVFETKQKIVLVMQYASGGELYDYLGCHHTLPEDEARRIFRQMASAIYYCHKNKICHRDLKLENILLDEEGNAQIADFGLSNIFDERRRMNTFCGSPLYASPEIVKGTPYKGPEVDCWSLGVLLYTLIYGTMPFDGRNFKDLVSQISEGRYEEPTNKSNASGLIRRLLTPEIAKRATIFDVCIDRWVNQGHTEPLVKIAEKMTSEALLKTRNLGAPKIYSESTTDIQEKVLQTPISIQRNKENIIVNGKTDNSTYTQSEVSQKASLFEQMLKYDVNFVMNQLLSAVESANPMMRITDKNASQSENLISALKPRNGENTGKVESAYVIPIFEVTSVMPKLMAKNIKNSNCEKSSQMCFSQNTTANETQFLSISETKNNKPKTKKKFTSSLNQSLSTPTDGNQILIKNGGEQTNKLEKQNAIIKNMVMTSKASIERDPAEILASNENMLPRLSSIKMKNPYDNPLLFGPKKPFFRSKNHSLSLARIFSMKYEKLVLDALKLPERKQKPPGKITIPATFDPSTICEETPERKEIFLLFPTVSVSENKEKIEKKIDRIKKAALNMNLIRRSNTNNRLRIQKFLRSQAKKMQDLVCDEHRSLVGSMEYIDQINGFPTNFCTFEKGNLNPFSIKHHNKKINFLNSNLSNPINPFAFDISNGEKWKFFGSENILTEDKGNLAVFGIAKSKSDIQFPNSYSEYNMTNSSYRSSYSSGYNSLSNTLSVPNSDCSLLRSASDSDGLNFLRNTPTIYTNKEYLKCAEGIVVDVHYNAENVKYDESSIQNESDKSYKISVGEAIQNVTNSTNLSQNVKLDVLNVQVGSSNITSLTNRNKENHTIRRSISTSNCLSSQKISANDLQNIKRLLLTPVIRNNTINQVINDTNNVSKYPFPLDINILEDNKIMEGDKECLRRYSFNGHPNYNEEKLSLTWNEIKSMGVDEIFNNYLWLPPGKQELLTLYQLNGGKCLSSPNLIDLDLDKNINFKIGNDGRSIDGFNIRAIGNDDILNYSPFSHLANMQNSMNNSTQSKQRLQTSDNVDEAFYDFSPRYKNRAISMNDNTLTNLESLLEYERKLSLPQGGQGKAPFLSKFLNDLERREQLGSTFDTSSSHNQKPCQRKACKPPKRSKLEKRSQSFLQLLALKRIQEAEKELEKVERNNRIEDDDESGSLLEALKTHGYKGVISQRFQNQDDDAMHPLNLRNPKSHYLARNYSPDMSYFHTMDYDTSPYLYSPYEDDDLDLEMLNGVTMRSLYEMFPKQNFPKQYIYDWLTANQNNEYSTSLRSDPTFEPEIPNTIKEPESPSYWSKENPRSFDEASSPESFEFPKDQMTNGTTNNELNPSRYPFTDNGEFSNYVRHDRNQLLRTPSAPERYEDYSKYASRNRNPSEDDEFSNYVRSDRNPLLRTASAPEEEKEESVQDRIWRKSFYSRFNNSVLSRKERSSFLDTCDSRAGFRERSLTPFKITSRDKLDRNGINVPQYKRYNKRRSSSSSDRTLDSGLSTSMKHIPLERTPTNTTLTNEMDEMDPEH